MPATLYPRTLTMFNREKGPLTEVEALRPGRITDKFHAREAGDRFHFAEADAVELEVRGVVRILDELTIVGRDYRAAFRAMGLSCGGYAAYANARFRDGPTDPAGDVGPPIKARPIGGSSFVVAGVLHSPGESVRQILDGRISETYKPGKPFEAPEGLLAVLFYWRMVELLGEPSPRFRRFVAEYAEYRKRCEKTDQPGPCPEY